MNETKPKMKFNIIDFIIIVIIIAVAVGIIMRGNIADSIAEKSTGDIIEYTIRIENIQKESYDYLNEGDELFSWVDDSSIGKIKSKQAPQITESYVSLADGSVVKTANPDRIDVVMTIECPGRHTEEGYMLNGNAFIAAGKMIEARTKNVTFSFQVEDVGLALAD